MRVLNDEEIIIAVCGDCPFEGRFSDEDCHACQRNMKASNQAQHDLDMKEVVELVEAVDMDTELPDRVWLAFNVGKLKEAGLFPITLGGQALEKGEGC